MPDKPEASRKPYRAPALRMLDADTAKAALETTAVPGDVGAIAMLNSMAIQRQNEEGSPQNPRCMPSKSQFGSP